MLQSLRQIKRRIRSVENTKKITQAMEMVSGAKLKRSEGLLYGSRPYFLGLDSLLNNLLSGSTGAWHPFLEERQDKQRIALCVVSSDTGLCSTYNDNIIHIAEDFINKYGREKIILVSIGKKAFSYFKKRGFSLRHSYMGLQGRLSDEISDDITKLLTQLFLTKEADEVYLVYTEFISVLKYRPKAEKLLNIEYSSKAREGYLIEPGLDIILEELLGEYIFTKIKFILLNSFTSEHCARMIAMKLATDNSQELIDSLTLSRNKARQGLITKEIIEVSSAAEILKR